MDQKVEKHFFCGFFYPDPPNLSCRQNSSTVKAKSQTFPGIPKININGIQLFIPFLFRASVRFLEF